MDDETRRALENAFARVTTVNPEPPFVDMYRYVLEQSGLPFDIPSLRRRGLAIRFLNDYNDWARYQRRVNAARRRRRRGALQRRVRQYIREENERTERARERRLERQLPYQW
jgi:hypothetical protein